MNKEIKKSRCGFVVIKLRIDDKSYYMMRENPSWKDINLIGGHEHIRDRDNLETTARRELLEEVPSLRRFHEIELVSLTGEVSYGPIYSQSAEKQVEYILNFFLVKFGSSPERVLKSAGPRTHNILVSEHELLSPRIYRVSELVGLLNDISAKGLRMIPYSWPDDVGSTLKQSNLLHAEFWQ
jgi:hypothetical protein